jgi:hypothetical protein
MRREAQAEADGMTVAMTQGVLNALHPKTRRAWDAGRRRRQAAYAAARPQTKVQAQRALAQLAAAFPDNVKIHGPAVQE